MKSAGMHFPITARKLGQNRTYPYILCTDLGNELLFRIWKPKHRCRNKTGLEIIKSYLSLGILLEPLQSFMRVRNGPLSDGFDLRLVRFYSSGRDYMAKERNRISVEFALLCLDKELIFE